MHLHILNRTHGWAQIKDSTFYNLSCLELRTLCLCRSTTQTIGVNLSSTGLGRTVGLLAESGSDTQAVTSWRLEPPSRFYKVSVLFVNFSLFSPHCVYTCFINAVQAIPLCLLTPHTLQSSLSHPPVFVCFFSHSDQVENDAVDPFSLQQQKGVLVCLSTIGLTREWLSIAVSAHCGS